MANQLISQFAERWGEKTHILLLCLLLLHIVLHIKYLDLPPVGFHRWRQTQTLSVARNFYEESMNILEPRVDSRGDQSGITGVEFPIVNYLVALAYQLLGNSYLVERFVLLLFSLLALVGCYHATRTLMDSPSLGLVGAGFLAFSPLFSYYSIVVMPEVPAIALMYVGLYFVLKWERSSRPRDFALSVVFLCFAALIKLSTLIVGPVWVWLLFRKRSSIPHAAIVRYFALGAVVLCVIGGWYMYARYLSDIHQNYGFRLYAEFPFPLSVIPHVANRVFVQYLPELYVNYAEFIFVVVGVVTAIRSRGSDLNRFLLLYAGGTALFMVSMFPMFVEQDYYMMPVIPLLIFLATLGLKRAWNWALEKPARVRLIVFLLVLVPILGSIRALSRFEGATIDHELMAMEQHLNVIVPDRTALLVAASNRSPSIYLYYMHRKGWPATDQLPTDTLRSYVKKGAQYLVSDSRVLEERVRPEIRLDSLVSFGRFTVFRLGEF
ncbi:MAG: glycosyltransferase family 39 protein [Ignavibacteriae bacterium]|nr:glycosyltransferase family 39 protein [Ignavibacteriota bacterium]